jgi:hypothetical protein
MSSAITSNTRAFDTLRYQRDVQEADQTSNGRRMVWNGGDPAKRTPPAFKVKPTGYTVLVITFCDCQATHRKRPVHSPKGFAIASW